jgi:Fur family ferric uptake transcriptional regulator
MSDGARFRLTKQRQVILDEVRKSHSHPTADEVYEKVREHVPKISLGTVYRNLDRLAQMGEIRKVQLSGAQARYDGEVGGHHHARCTACGRIADVSVEALPEIKPLGRRVDGFSITGLNVELLGLCSRCRGKAR